MTSIDHPIDIAFSFDTTGSMYPCLAEVRRNMVATVNALFSDIPNLRISIIAHGDYCDRKTSYTIKFLDFSSDRREICDFIKSVGSTGGGDVPECYELVLKTARESLNWRKDSTKALTVIGDATPHDKNYPDNIYNIDWQKEIVLYKELDIKICSIHAMASCRKFSKSFYEIIADTTGGLYLTLEQFSDINDILVGICYNQQENKDMLNRFVERIKPTANRNMRRVISTLTNTKIEEYTTIDRKLVGLDPVPNSRFQVFEIPNDGKVAIKSFVQEQGITFKIGRGFYELTKPEDVQQYKEVILQDMATGDFFNGADARNILGLAPQIEGSRGSGTTERIVPSRKDFKHYRVFIQSTSVNRALIPGTHFLYEVPDWDVTLDDVEKSKLVREPSSISLEKKPAEKKTVEKKTVEIKPEIKKSKDSKIKATEFTVTEKDGYYKVANGEEHLMILAKSNLGKSFANILSILNFKD